MNNDIAIARACAASHTQGVRGFPLRLLQARRKKDLTQTELGYLAEVDNKMISHYETGRNLPGVETVIALSNVLEVSIDYLLKG